MADALMENWDATKDALTDGLTGTKKAVMETTLENTKKHLMETASTGATQAGNVATLNKVILPVIRRVMPTVIANEIVGVQPMTGPVGQIHTLRVRYAETFDTATAGDEALSPFAIATGYSGNETTNKADATYEQCEHNRYCLGSVFRCRFFVGLYWQLESQPGTQIYR